MSETDDGFLPVDISGPRINVLFAHFAHFAPVELNEFHRLFGIHVAMILQLSEHHNFLDLQGGALMNHHTVWPGESMLDQWHPNLAAAAKSLQSCPTLCDPIDSSPPGSPVPGILQARTLEWVAISFSNA